MKRANWKNKKLLIVGTGRCGTQFMADKFNIGHEKYFNLSTKFGDELDSDSSWLAVPWLPLLNRNEWDIVHLVRHPQKVCGSLRVTLFGHKSPWLEFVKFHGCHDVLSFYKRWIEMIVSHGVNNTVKLEDMNGEVMNVGIDHPVWPAEDLKPYLKMFGYEECL